MDRSAILETITRHLAQRPEAVAAYVFGSVARGDAHAESDIDVGVLLRDGTPKSLEAFDPVFAIQDELEAQCGRHVDVVVMNEAPLDLLHRILRDGVLVLDRDPLQRMEFELRARTEYFDFLPILLRYRKTVLERA